MTTDTNSTAQNQQKTKVFYKGATNAPVYGLGLIGAWAYYLSQAETIWMGVLGILKGIVWPAMLVYELLKYLNM